MARLTRAREYARDIEHAAAATFRLGDNNEKENKKEEKKKKARRARAKRLTRAKASMAAKSISLAAGKTGG